MRSEPQLGIAAAIVTLLAFAACGDSGEPGSSPTGSATPTPAVARCTDNTSVALGELSWLEVVPAEIPAPDGWTVRDDPGGGPFLLVFAGDEAVGSLELLQFPLEPDFDATAGFAALETLLQDYYGSIESDREATYADNYTFEPEPIQQASVGALCGAAYGFSGIDASGQEVERLRGYATYDPDSLYLFTALYDAAIANEMGFVDAASLREFESYFGQLIAGLRLPAE